GATLKPPPCTANVANAANAAITTTTTTTNIINNNNNNNETHLHPLPSNANAIKPNLIDTTSLSTNTNTTTNDNCKLETILEQDDCQQVKLSPNFNRIYNSKVRIVVDTEPSTAAVTHCDSLSSLEEISSNPDSGNVSLTDFPLNSQANASLQLQSSYNSRFEVKEHYVSEIAIATTEDDDDDDEDETERKDIAEVEFPPLPTAEELYESLREDVENDESRPYEKVADLLNSFIEDLDLNTQEALTLSQEVYNLANGSMYKSLEASKEEMRIEALPILIEEDEDECDSVAQSSRIVYETPQLNLSITELKVNYETKVEQDKEMETVQEATAAVTDDMKTNDQISINDTLASNEQEHKEDEEEEANEETATRCRKGHPVRHIDANANDVQQQQQQEQPTTSRKALSVFGEQRLVALPRHQQQQLAAGGGAAVHLGSGLTTLEHVLVACTVGLITPNDLLTLCLIVIGVIIIIAIALN
ncbi:ras guanine nucleotide exchange factor C-like, partial [Drosophila tropicalis]|uniref:ras guanine nucleotide exchange factor C-like n=1 Tax=Drosophila tropicalis TaxID=46794 RepID=UPI0035AB8ADC